MSDNPQWEIIQGDALKVLSGFLRLGPSTR